MTTQPTDVIVLGGGLSGLAAAYELETQGVRYTLVEVKPRLGGGVLTETVEGFVMDGGPFAFPLPGGWPTLEALGLAGSLIPVARRNGPGRYAFAAGTQTLTDALAARLNGRIIRRMAVTSIGERAAGPGYAVCLENGLALEARAVVVAVPARYAERIFRTLAPEVAAAMQGYHYDRVTRLALGYRAGNCPAKLPDTTPEMTFAALHATDHPARTPAGGMLIQAAVRTSLTASEADRLAELVALQNGWPAPDVIYAHTWAESDPLTVSGPPHLIHRANDALPDGVRLVGSCYRALSLPERTEAAREAARAVIATL